MSNEVIIKQILREYKFEQPIPVEVQKKMYRSKRKTLIKILKEYGKYPFIITFVISFLLWIKKFGVTLTIAKSTAIVTVISISAALIIGTGGYITIDAIIRNHASPKTKISKMEDVLKIETPVIDNRTIDKIAPIKFAPAIKYKLAIKPFENSNMKGSASAIVKIIRDELIKIKGKHFAVITSSPKKQGADHQLSGSVIKLGSTYRITVKIIDIKSRKIISYFSEKASSEKDLNDAGKRIAKRISGLL